MKLLIVAAHPDDEVLGCFGTVSKLIKKGYEAYTLILSQGKTSRGEGDEEIAILKEEIQKANGVIGIKKIFLENFPDNSFDSVPLLTIIKKISKVIEEIKPEIIFTHYANDLNIDHRLTYQALITATRPMQGCFVKEIYSFEILSSTEWNYPLSFSPDIYFDITDTLENKIKAMNCYKSELRDFPHPRSLKGIELNAHYWGMRVGKKAIEAFKVVRIIK
jgi:LmbE family N-acetylglucosaminyl deacetylase